MINFFTSETPVNRFIAIQERAEMQKEEVHKFIIMREAMPKHSAKLDYIISSMESKLQRCLYFSEALEFQVPKLSEFVGEIEIGFIDIKE